MTDWSLEAKLDALRASLAHIGPSAVAFSAGVDSTLLLAVAHEVLNDDVVALTARMPVNPDRELNEAKELCAQMGVRHIVLDADQLAIDGFADNPPDRCYRCKRFLFERMVARAASEGFPSVLEGSNTDDAADYRPGFAAVVELGVHSPLLDAGLSKQDIRNAAQAMGLPTWNKQSFACLATRFPYGMHITQEALGMVAAAEQILLDEGFRVVRVRVPERGPHGPVARLEVGADEVARLRGDALMSNVSSAITALGFAAVEVDAQGYRTGAMNATLPAS